MLGQQIKQARKEEGLTQEELAKKVSTTKSVISEIERGKRNIGFDTLSKIAEALKRTIAEPLLLKKDNSSQ
ncbi:helix-turn-helix transcriptional regulator [Pontibacter sp. BT731]|uniref:helix-turn-helix domain-containing protein n=1 Tax=Pontibacter coccineus TaxID=3063328 RepID=UPI0026E1CB45|nr:helix-turn-helix transcriptional regulator [Pontibacter sp. BT731]MDO6389007.1 helix-turn-helix transcriptional regulator [Pontibacter sp. BT731]